jgi:hypothetical protein
LHLPAVLGRGGALEWDYADRNFARGAIGANLAPTNIFAVCDGRSYAHCLRNLECVAQ